MRELLILILIGTAAYLGYDDYYRQRPALERARGELQQLRDNPVRLAATPVPRAWAPANPTPPTWFQKQLNDGSSLELPRRHTRQGEQPVTPHP